MISNHVKKRVERILAGLVSVAMTLTMVPEIWLPINAQIVRDEIMDTETAVRAKNAYSSVSNKSTENYFESDVWKRSPQ